MAIGGSVTDGYGMQNNQFQIFQFNRVNNSLTPVAGELAVSLFVMAFSELEPRWSIYSNWSICDIRRL